MFGSKAYVETGPTTVPVKSPSSALAERHSINLIILPARDPVGPSAVSPT